MCGRFAQVQTCSDYLDMLASDLEFASALLQRGARHPRAGD